MIKRQLFLLCILWCASSTVAMNQENNNNMQLTAEQQQQVADMADQITHGLIATSIYYLGSYALADRLPKIDNPFVAGSAAIALYLGGYQWRRHAFNQLAAMKQYERGIAQPQQQRPKTLAIWWQRLSGWTKYGILKIAAIFGSAGAMHATDQCTNVLVGSVGNTTPPWIKNHVPNIVQIHGHRLIGYHFNSTLLPHLLD